MIVYVQGVMSIPHLGDLGDAFTVPSYISSTRHIFNLSDAKQWGLPRNCVGYNNGRLANGFL